MTVSKRYSVRDGRVMCELSGFGRELLVETDLDPATFRDLGDGYAKDEHRVVHGGDPIEADPGSFVTLGHGYAKDRAAVFLDGALATEPDRGPWDAPSFRVFGARYVADTRGVFCIRYGYDCFEALEVAEADADDFEELGLTFARAPMKKLVFNNAEAAPELEADSFELRGPFFALDAHAVYHLAYGGKHTDEVHLRRIDADPRSFALRSDHYATDRERVFWYLNDPGDAEIALLRVLPGIDPSRFETITLEGYARVDGVILNHGDVETAISDPASFEVLLPSKKGEFGAIEPGYARDRAHVYRMTPSPRTLEDVHLTVLLPERIEGADPATFQLP